MMQHIVSRKAIVGSVRSMASSYHFVPSTFLLDSLFLPPAAAPRFFSSGLLVPPPSGLVTLTPELPSDALVRKTERKLDKLNGEIDSAIVEIHVEKAKRERTPVVAEKAVILKSDVLNEALEGLRATRDKLIDTSIAASVPAPGENSFPLCACCAVDAPSFVGDC